MLDNSFTCSNGHTFKANAKIRARCPDCGVTAKRDFKALIPDPAPKIDPVEPVVVKVDPKPNDPKPEPKKPVLLKQGRPRPVMAARKTSAKPPVKKPAVKSNLVSGGKAASGLVTSHRIKSRGTMPTIKARPIKTAPARGVKDHGSSRSTKPFWHDVADKYGI